MPAVVAESWWLEWCTPERLHWARLRVFQDGSAEVFDLDGAYHRFPDEQEARYWLNEDEYSSLAHMIEDGEVEAGLVPPSAGSDAELVPLMLVVRPDAAS